MQNFKNVFCSIESSRFDFASCVYQVIVSLRIEVVFLRREVVLPPLRARLAPALLVAESTAKCRIKVENRFQILKFQA